MIPPDTALLIPLIAFAGVLLGAFVTAVLAYIGNSALERLKAELRERGDDRVEERRAELRKATEQAIEAVKADLRSRFDQLADAEKHARNTRADIYLQFLKANAALAFAENRRQALEDLTTAKTQIAFFGSAGVVAALAEFSRGPDALSNPLAQRQFRAVLLAMRDDLAREPAAVDDIQTILFGAESKSRVEIEPVGQHRV